jgi:hypothetical protein
MRVKENFNKKLLVEGNDDQHVIWALCEKYNLNENFDVVDCEGISRLYDQLPIRFKQSGIETIGIIVDADTEIHSRWVSLKAILNNQGFVFQDELPKSGLIAKNEDNVKIGVWIMPNNDLDGMLEDFISFLVPEGDSLLPIVTATLNAIEEKELNNYSLIHKSKAAIHTWLSWQEDPGTPMGLSITKKYLTTDQETCMSLIDWLRQLFG